MSQPPRARLHRFSSTAPTINVAPGVVVEEEEADAPELFDSTTFDRERRALSRKMGVVACGAGAAWAALGVLVLDDALSVGRYDTWFPGRVLAYVLLILAPGLTFTPIGVRLGLRYYAPLATVCWAALGFIFAFVSPGVTGNTIVPLVGFLLLAFGALAVLFTPMFYALGLRFFVWRLHRYDIGRAQREGFLTALFLIVLGFLRALDSLSIFNGLLLLVVLCIVEALFLSRG